MEHNARHEPEITHVGHMRNSLQAVHGILKMRCHIARAIEKFFLVVQTQRRLRCRRGYRMPRIRVAVKELDHTWWRVIDDGVVDFGTYDDTGKRDGRIGNAFGESDHIRNYAKGAGGKCLTRAPESGDDFV